MEHSELTEILIMIINNYYFEIQIREWNYQISVPGFSNKPCIVTSKQ